MERSLVGSRRAIISNISRFYGAITTLIGRMFTIFHFILKWCDKILLKTFSADCTPEFDSWKLGGLREELRHVFLPFEFCPSIPIKFYISVLSVAPSKRDCTFQICHIIRWVVAIKITWIPSVISELWLFMYRFSVNLWYFDSFLVCSY